MDSYFDVSPMLPQDNTTADARQRFESFKFGGGVPPPSQATHLRRPSHARSRSRNNSVTSFTFPSHSQTPSMNDVPSQLPPVPSNSPPKRPNSHHRRRSSVSTRCESAELMGVSIPDLPLSNSNDNVNFGDKDSIRRRALWALEGKPDVSFAKVEIPELDSPSLSKGASDFPPKPSYAPASSLGGFSNGLGATSGKRDSFKFMTSTSSMDQLGTLLEEEEEEEEDVDEQEKEVEEYTPAFIAPLSLEPISLPKPASRPRPASLNLRPLSLVASNTVQSAPSCLPTPTQTPSPRPPVLRSRTLGSSSGSNGMPHSASPDRFTIVTNPLSNDGCMAAFASSPVRRPSLDSQADPSDVSLKRRSSIGYKHSNDSTSRDLVALPTPELTPTERKFSTALDSESSAPQPLSAAEQHFLFKSHNLLLARISDLERALRTRSRSPASRPISLASDASLTPSEPSAELLQVVADLKAERDELKRDVEGWRTRVADANQHASLLTKRIEQERRDAWVARSRLGLLEMEKAGVDKLLVEKTNELRQTMEKAALVEKERDDLRFDVGALQARLQDADFIMGEVDNLRASLDQERARRIELEKMLEDVGMGPTPKVARAPFQGSFRFRGFQSIDSESSTTDVESVDDTFMKAETTLNSVTEEDEEADSDEDALVGYEDEDDTDMSFQSPDGSSIGSEDELSTRFLQTPSRPSHVVQGSLSKTWTFPRGKAVEVEQADEVDHFFGCLDDSDNSPLDMFGDDGGKGLFASSFGQHACDDDELPFIIPAHVGTVDGRPPSVVIANPGDIDEDELTFHGEEVEGGIKFTFNPPPPVFCVTPSVDDDDTSYFDYPAYEHAMIPTPDDNAQEEPESMLPEMEDSPSTPTRQPHVLRAPSPSSIPRAVNSWSFSSTTTPPSASRVPTGPSSRSFASPPSRIPQLATPSKLPRISGKVSTAGTNNGSTSKPLPKPRVNAPDSFSLISQSFRQLPAALLRERHQLATTRR
ncbi:hypothetical protein CONPUDRAFT_81942 [Coniophora puteana RWD-64-598 SS2]|uniref:Uncharacterized protein n=1 Tax=Coniophora puteana (strain RWD-64-598) TaxID=741705 RepID=A0A5M3MTQ7_CONPW|nr:uncharacterized protein CONPUDRAFT_81942 [Coniophora puteana RWD-64-598 SS2]EIW82470.1 hypothetical protein CONPUDRAFT_81942 [Coniophora puteana RWD-64-598 SS2]